MWREKKGTSLRGYFAALLTGQIFGCYTWAKQSAFAAPKAEKDLLEIAIKAKEKGAAYILSETFKIGIDFAVLAVVYTILLHPRWKRMGKPVSVTHTLMYLYLTGVLYFTLMPIVTAIPSIINHPYVPMNLNPFGDLVTRRGSAALQIALNVVMMMPFGFLLPLCRKSQSRRCGMLFCIVCTTAFSLFIELLQPLINGFRASDITDIITNTVGGLLGYLCYLVLRPIAYRLVGIRTSTRTW